MVQLVPGHTWRGVGRGERGEEGEGRGERKRKVRGKEEEEEGEGKGGTDEQLTIEEGGGRKKER